uniref:PAZ domain-containing protein n=1 Tax=Panagrellus redivivus TaxID=6233 RepID=A0A7E4ZQB3_PANRE
VTIRMNLNISIPIEAFPNVAPSMPIELTAWLAATWPELTVFDRVKRAAAMLHGRILLTSMRLGPNSRGRRFRFLNFSTRPTREIRIRGGPMSGTPLPAYFKRKHGIHLAESADFPAAYGVLPDGSEGHFPLEL